MIATTGCAYILWPQLQRSAPSLNSPVFSFPSFLFIVHYNAIPARAFSFRTYMWQILYLEGKWLCLPQLVDLVEPARLRSLMPLHNTNIRNEQVRAKLFNRRARLNGISHAR